MKKTESFMRSIAVIAIPVALQSMLQSSFSIVDQLMIGQLGCVSIDAIGLAGKFSSIFTVVVSAVGSVAGIFISQYIGSKRYEAEDQSFRKNLWISIAIAAIFMAISILLAPQIMRLYIKDKETIMVSAGYLRIISISFVPIAIATICSALLRCIEKAFIAFVASLVSVGTNTILNYILIFGKCGAPKLGITGAAIATVVSSFLNAFIIIIGLCCTYHAKRGKREKEETYLAVLLPILANEFLWSLGENVYAMIYGHTGKESLAAMTLSYPIQGLFIGALSGLAGAATVIVGKKLGAGKMDEAYHTSKKLLFLSLVGSIILSIVLIIFREYYVDLFQIEAEVKQIGEKVLLAFACIAPVKVLNMVLAGGIIRSGGDTKTVMYIDIIGTWLIGIPLGLISAFLLKLPIYSVYFILSLEEVVRFVIALFVMRGRKWMIQIK